MPSSAATVAPSACLARRWPRPRSARPAGCRDRPSCGRWRRSRGSPSAAVASCDVDLPCDRIDRCRADGRVYDNIWMRGTQTSDVHASRSGRPAQRDGPAIEPERDRPSAPPSRPALAVRARRPYRPDPFGDPRPRSASSCVAGSSIESRSAPAGTPGPALAPGPSRPRRAPRPWRLEINVDSLAAARVGLGGTIDELVRVDRPRAHVTVDRDRRRPFELARPIARCGRRRPCRHRRRCGRRRPPSAMASFGSPRTSAGTTSRLASGSRRRFDLDVPARDRQRGRPRRAGGASPRARRSGRRDVRLRGGRGRRWRRPDVGGQPLDGRGRLRGRDRAHARQSRTAGPARCGSFGCWETEIGERAMLVRGRPTRHRRTRRGRRAHRRRDGRRAGRVRQRRATRGSGSASAWRRWSTSSTRRWLCWAACSAGSIHWSRPELDAALERRALPASRVLVRGSSRPLSA